MKQKLLTCIFALGITISLALSTSQTIAYAFNTSEGSKQSICIATPSNPDMPTPLYDNNFPDEA